MRPRTRQAGVLDRTLSYLIAPFGTAVEASGPGLYGLCVVFNHVYGFKGRFLDSEGRNFFRVLSVIWSRQIFSLYLSNVCLHPTFDLESVGVMTTESRPTEGDIVFMHRIQALGTLRA
jgi:hypothetical protein